MALQLKCRLGRLLAQNRDLSGTLILLQQAWEVGLLLTQCLTTNIWKQWSTRTEKQGYLQGRNGMKPSKTSRAILSLGAWTSKSLRGEGLPSSLFFFVYKEENMTVITVIILVLVSLLILYVLFDPTFDWVEVGGKQKRIMWYNNLKGERNWIFL